MTITAADSKGHDPLSTGQTSLKRWYMSLNARSDAAADVWLTNMKMVERLYGESPRSIAAMSPEEAYNFVINMVRSLLNQGRSPGYIEGMIKSINDWLEFTDPERSRSASLPREITQVLNLSEKIFASPENEFETSQKSPEYPALYDDAITMQIREKSDALLRLHGLNLVSELRNLEALLGSMENPDPLIDTVDKMVNKDVAMDLGAYYLAAYSVTKDPRNALEVYRLVNSLMRYVALSDAFYETGDKASLQRANSMIEEIAATSRGQMRSSIQLSIEKFWPFWLFENMIKQRMLDGSSFSDKELRSFILLKSSDTPLLYCAVLDALLESFSPNIAMIFHYNQALIDVLDDYYDFNEDIATQMPNIFALASSSPSALLRSALGTDHASIETGAKSRVLSVVGWIEERLGEISVPSEYTFLKEIAAEHISRLKRELR